MGKKKKVRLDPDNKNSFSKIPSAQSSDSISPNEDIKIIVSLKEFDVKTLKKLDPKEEQMFLDKLYKISQSSWRTANVSGRHKGGSEKITKHNLTYPILKGENLIAFRCIAKKPLLGFRKKNTFIAVHFDYNMKAYDH